MKDGVYKLYVADLREDSNEKLFIFKFIVRNPNPVTNIVTINEGGKPYLLLTFMNGDTRKVDLSSLAGLKGDKGDQGLAGPKGDQGSAGPKGDKGDQGPAGPKGDKGDRGDKGDKGDQGPSGPAGQKGDKGDQGPKGDQGAAGSLAGSGLQLDYQDGFASSLEKSPQTSDINSYALPMLITGASFLSSVFLKKKMF